MYSPLKECLCFHKPTSVLRVPSHDTSPWNKGHQSKWGIFEGNGMLAHVSQTQFFPFDTTPSSQRRILHRTRIPGITEALG